MAGLKIVGEVEPSDRNRVEVVDETDDGGLKIPKVTFTYSHNDRKLTNHALQFMQQTLEAAGAQHGSAITSRGWPDMASSTKSEGSLCTHQQLKNPGKSS